MKKLLLILLMFVCSVWVYGQKIEDLPRAAIPAATDLVILDQADATRAITVAALLMGPPAPWVGLFPDGTVGAPGGTFWNDTDVGFYRPGADILGFTAGAVEGFRITEAAGAVVNTFTDDVIITDLASANTVVLTPTATGQIDTLETSDITEVTLDTLDVNYIEANSRLIVDPDVTGSAAAPSLAFGDGNTGFYESSDNALQIVTIGTSRFTLTSSGIWAANGASMKNTSATATTPVFVPDNDDSNSGISTAGPDSLSLVAGGVEAARFAEGAGAIKVTITDTLEVGGAGTIRFAETSTPYALDSYGAIYAKSDNSLYFQDGAGTEHVVNVNSTDYGEMGNVYGSSASEVLHSANEWHAMFHANISGAVPHLNSGFSFVAGKEGSGTTTTAGTGDSINIADAAHGLLDGDIVTVQSANHATTAYVNVVDAGNFEIKVTYAADEAITWQMGSYLLIATADVYKGSWAGSFSQSLNNTQTSIVSPFLNITQATKATAARLLANNSDVGSIGGNGLMDFSVGDRIWFAAQTTAAQTLTFTVRNVSIR